ncbi:hypothetical protein M569_17158, partial [Genlisea aurea]
MTSFLVMIFIGLVMRLIGLVMKLIGLVMIVIKLVMINDQFVVMKLVMRLICAIFSVLNIAFLLTI